MTTSNLASSNLASDKTKPSWIAQLGTWVGVRPTHSEASTPEAMDVQSGERVVWSRVQRSRWPLLVAGAVVVLFSVLGVIAPPDVAGLAVLGVAGLIGVVATLSFSRIQVTVDPEQVSVRFGWMPWPVKRIAIADIESASVIDLLPTEWGGWGYRVSGLIKGLKRTAVVLRKGEAIQLNLASGRVFAVTIDGADEGAALITTYLDA